MINSSTNSVEFDFRRSQHNADILPPSTTQNSTKIIQNSLKCYTTTPQADLELDVETLMACRQNVTTTTTTTTKNETKNCISPTTKELNMDVMGNWRPLNSDQRDRDHDHHDRVKVQRIETHTKLQSNSWDYKKFYNICNAVPQNFNKNEKSIKFTQKNESAFKECNKIVKNLIPNNIFVTMEESKNKNNNNNNNNFNNHNNNNNNTNTNNHNNNNNNTIELKIDEPNTKTYTNSNSDSQTVVVEVGKTTTAATTAAAATLASPSYRNMYQESAFRRIEDVHNYAKLNYNSHANSSNSSIAEEDEELDDEIDDDSEDMGSNYEQYFRNKQKIRGIHKQPSVEHSEENIKILRTEILELEEDMNIDVETVPKDEHFQMNATQMTQITPEHHARRPMNAFLIFCKRHRAIVKDRYKSLENRAITKILGDWWASLDTNDKKVYTNLAQQNKDAFFSANPNFKWYKLPAPPLRTLNIRPNNVERLSAEHELMNDSNSTSILSTAYNLALTDSTTTTTTTTTKSDDFFKLADEAQMGELSSLLSDDRKNVQHFALQEALGETTKFFSQHMPQRLETNGSENVTNGAPINTVAVTVPAKRTATEMSVGRKCMKRLHNGSSFSSNSSEEEVLPKKSTRSCKGKRYQELINSGQIAANNKKMKMHKTQNCNNQRAIGCSSVGGGGGVGVDHNLIPQELSLKIDDAKNQTVMPSSDTTTVNGSNAPYISFNVAGEVETYATSYDLVNFDLDEKIKELPVLSLDGYLQRKRNTKKKKKITTKKRNSNSASSTKSSTTLIPKNEVHQVAAAAATAHAPPAEGSQKRKPRKESITRRDISAIEDEVTSVITANFTNMNGWFDGTTASTSTPTPTPTPTSILVTPTTAKTTTTTQQPTNLVSNVSNLISQQIIVGPGMSNNFLVTTNINDSNSTTSDLLILAEVAANRTEISN